MNLKPIEQLYADPTNRVDDRIDQQATTACEVFELTKTFKHWTTTDKPAKEVADQLVIASERLRVLTTALPTRPLVLAKEAGDIVFDTPALVKITPTKQGYFVEAFSNGAKLYWHDELCERIKAKWELGTRLYVDGLLLELREAQLKLTPLRQGIMLNIDKLLPTKRHHEYPVDFPNFRRSPRIYLQEPKQKLRLENVPTPQTPPQGALMQMIVPPLGMVVASGLVSLLSGGNGLMMLGMGSASVLTAGFSISSYFTNKKMIQTQNKQANAAYEQYLLSITGQLAKLNQEQRAVMQYDHPTSEEIAAMMYHYDPRLYERMLSNDDFLTLSLGQGTLPISYQFEHDKNDAKIKSKLEKFIEQKIIEPYEKVENIPVTIGLRQTTLGLAGNSAALRQALQTTLFQLAAFHSYHDVQFVAVLNEAEYQDHWQEWRWLPHFQLESLNLRGLVYNAQTRDMVLNSLYQMLVKRRQEYKEQRNSREAMFFKPQIVLVIQDESWLTGHNLNEFLMEDMSRYGVTVIWAKETLAMLPETVTTLVDYHSSKLGTLINEDQTYLNLEFVPNSYPKKITQAAAIKRLANLRHVEVEKNSIPESISFLQLYQVKRVAELNVKKRWQLADTSKTLAVPLGVRGKNDVVNLNLHERAHGPHGLLAGTTGSGKSEVLQSFILSLAVNFAPEDVGFLPIDYKGGGMANLFADLPHLLGSITNLDGASTARALKSIHAELERRQRLFREFGVNHINGYTKLYKKGKVGATDRVYPTEPLPHLFLISDEFAELKANEPEFMNELVSTARIGRSLGVHLILATQKPSGVVNEQIWSNSRFKIALKVAEPADSKEVIKTPDAASITLPGRGYLQVGNNEIYELFQTAYSGAKYVPDEAQNAAKADDRIWLINHLGQAELLTADLSLANEEQQSDTEETELEAVVKQIKNEAEKLHVPLPSKPWLPPLAKVMVAPEIDWRANWQTDRDLKVPLGMVDIPSKQKQEPLMFDLAEFAPAVLVGSSGYGKSTLLQTLVVNLAKQNSPIQVQFYLLDFGTNGLLPLRDLPHTADIAGLDDREKLFKMLRILERLLDQRKAQFQEVAASNIVQYQMETGEKLSVILVAVDAYDNITEDEARERIDQVLNRLIREGQALGVNIVITANRINSLRATMLANINKRLSLYMVDKDEYKSMQGYQAPIQSPIPGRGQIELEEILDFQAYLPTKQADVLASVKELRKLAETMSDNWTGDLPAKVPMLPKEISEEYFFGQDSVKEMISKGHIPLALVKETTMAVGFKPQMKYFVIMEDTPQQEDSLEQTLIVSLSKLDSNYVKYVIDFDEDYLNSGFDEIITSEMVGEFFKEIEELVMYRENHPDYVTKHYIYVPNLVDNANSFMLTEGHLKKILYQGSSVGIYFIFRDEQSKLLTAYDPISKVVRNGIMSCMLGTRVADQNYIKAKKDFKEPPIGMNEINFVEASKASRSCLITKWEK
ncbi:type VII secretion protein EssC [Ligilactobacillus murinus]|uniref:type VII secretion protein EssC n=1 Tax=Ligilactobacillus murinus TaxID=1622 RepID=UPI0010941A3D|nr:type VII secretion protein EssC [Ligilactobacillus murinus]TGY52053.1 type VII secretion protein EssC [Ligilactobacillus murinus]